MLSLVFAQDSFCRDSIVFCGTIALTLVCFPKAISVDCMTSFFSFPFLLVLSVADCVYNCDYIRPRVVF